MIRVMADQTLTDAHRHATRQRILEGAASVLLAGEVATLTIPAVAEAAGVSVRTVYRYFPTKDDLVEGVAALDDPATSVGLPRVDGSDLHAWLRRGWSTEAQTPLLRAQMRTAAGTAVRRARRSEHRAFAYAVLDAWGIDVAGRARESIADLLLLLTGGAALVELTEVLGSDVERATGTAAWAVEAVLTHAQASRPPLEGETLEMRPPGRKGD